MATTPLATRAVQANNPRLTIEHSALMRLLVAIALRGRELRGLMRDRAAQAMRVGVHAPAESEASRALASALSDLRSTLEPSLPRPGTPHEFGWTHLHETLERVYTTAAAAGFSRSDVLVLLRALDRRPTGTALPDRLGGVLAHVARLRASPDDHGPNTRRWKAGT